MYLIEASFREYSSPSLKFKQCRIPESNGAVAVLENQVMVWYQVPWLPVGTCMLESRELRGGGRYPYKARATVD